MIDPRFCREMDLYSPESPSTCSTTITSSSSKMGDCDDTTDYDYETHYDAKRSTGSHKGYKEHTGTKENEGKRRSTRKEDEDDEMQLFRAVERFESKLNRERDTWAKEKRIMEQKLRKLKEENAALTNEVEKALDEKEEAIEKVNRLSKPIKGCEGGTCRKKLRSQESKLKEKKEAMVRSMTMEDHGSTVVTKASEESEVPRKSERRRSSAAKLKSFLTGGTPGRRKSSKTFGFFRGSRDLANSNPQSDSFKNAEGRETGDSDVDEEPVQIRRRELRI